MKIYLTKTKRGLIPLTEIDMERLREWPIGQTRQVDAREKRNPMHHRKLMGLLRSVVENGEDFNSVEHLLTALKVKLGHVDIVRGLDGEMITQARSVSFADMDQDDFNQFYDGCLRLCAEYLGVNEYDLETEVWR